MAECVKDPVDALVAEVERRKKLPGLHNYSYGRLIADTTEEERRRLVEAAGMEKKKKKLDPGKKEIVCACCGKRHILTVKSGGHRKYCSIECQVTANRRIARERARLASGGERLCRVCGQPFVDKRYKVCRNCRIQRELEVEQGLTNTLAPKKEPAPKTITAVCSCCGKEFERSRKSKVEYCSSQCRFRLKYKPEEIRSRDSEGRRICMWCGSLLNKGRAKYCSPDCRRSGHNRYLMGMRLGVPVDG